MGEVRQLLVDARPVNHPTAKNRGIGRYTIGLLGGLMEAGAPLVALYETEEEADLLRASLPTIPLRRWCPATIRDLTAPGSWYLATQLMLHPIPLDPVPRIITDAGLPVAAVMYDVIPERYPAQYQARPTARAQVQLRGALTRTLDALLAISDFAADTAAIELRFPRDRIATIGAGVDAHFLPAHGDPRPQLSRVLADDRRQIVLMVAGTDSRKNTERMIAAWGLVPATIRADHQLVIVGAVDDTLLDQWRRWAVAAHVDGAVTFTGSVSDEEMVALHQAAALAVMPSTEEGFGLPVLEAAACGCPVITSNVSSLPEVLAYPPAEFDPYDVAAIATAVERALTDASHRAALVQAGQRAVERWTWARTGADVMAALTALGPRRERALQSVPRRVAVRGTFDDSAVGLANTLLVDALRAQPSAPEVHLLVDTEGTDNPAMAAAHRFPSRALGRSVHASLFDHVVNITVDGDGRSARLADATRCALAGDDSVADAMALLSWLDAAERNG